MAVTSIIESRVETTRTALYVVGLTVAGIGIAGLLQAHLGTDPYDAINAAIALKTGILVGTVSWINSAIVLAGAWALGRRPKIGTILLALGVGLVINLGMHLIPAPHSIGVRCLMAAASLALLYLGVTGFVLSDRGAGCLEELMLAIVARGGRIHRTRWGIEAVLLVIALVLQGPINVVTVIFVILTGPVLAGTLPALATLCRVPLPHHDPNVPLGDIR